MRAAFAHRRKALARSVANSGVATRERVLAALEELGLEPTVRAEQLEPAVFIELSRALEAGAGRGGGERAWLTGRRRS